MGVMESILKLTLIDGITAKAGRISGALGKLNQQGRLAGAPVVGAIGRIAAIGGAYIGVTEGIEGTVGAARKMQAALTEIGIKSGQTQAQLDQMGGSVMRLAPKVNQTTSDLLAGVDAMVTLGLSAEDAMAAMPAIGKAATATKSSITDLSTASVSAMQNFKVGSSEISRMLDGMAEAGNQGAFETRDMAQYFPALTAAASSLGMDGVDGILDLAAALQIARRGAGDASTAANNMANFVGKIMSPEVSKRFKKFGVDTTKELEKAHKLGISPIEHFIKLVDEKTDGGKADLLGQLFGDKQVLDFVRPMISDFKDYLRIRGDAERASGTVAQAYARRMEDAEEKIRAFRIQMENLGLSFGAKALGPLGNAAGKLAHILDTLDKRVGVFDKLRAAFDGFAGGLGQGDAAKMLGNVGTWLEEGIFGKEFTGSVKEVDGRVSELARLSNRFREIGANIRDFANSVADNPLGRFLADMAGHGFKLMLASVGIGMLASAIWKLGKAAAFLSGLTAAVGIVKGLAKVGGAVLGGGAAVATTATTVAKGGAKATGTTAKGASAVAAGAKQGGSWLSRWLSGEGVKDLVSSGRKSTQLTGFEKLGKATGILGRGVSRIMGVPAIAAEVTARALIDKGLSDERFKDPNFAPWAIRNAEDRAAGREPLPEPKQSNAVPFSFRTLFSDLMKPAGAPDAHESALEEARLKVAEINKMLAAQKDAWARQTSQPLPRSESTSFSLVTFASDLMKQLAKLTPSITEKRSVPPTVLSNEVHTGKAPQAISKASQAVPFSFTSLVGDFMKQIGKLGPIEADVSPAQRAVDALKASLASATTDWPAAAQSGIQAYVNAITSGGGQAESEAGRIGEGIRQALTVNGKPTVDTSQLQHALGIARQLGSAVQSLGSKGAALPSRQIDGKRAKGGGVRAGGTYLVGELGPELVTFSKAGMVHTALSTARMMRNAAIASSALALPAAAQGDALPQVPPLTGAEFNLSALMPQSQRQSRNQRGANPVEINVSRGAIVVRAAAGQSPEQIAKEVERRISARLAAFSRGAFSDGAN